MTDESRMRGPRTLVLSRQLAHPPRSGGALREMTIIRALGAVGPTSVFALAPGGPAPDKVTLEGWNASSDPGAAAMAQGHDLVTALRNEESPFNVVVSDVAAAELASHIEQFAPEVVVVCGIALAAYVPQLRASGVHVVLDSDFAFSDAIATMGAEDSNRARGLTFRLAAKLAARIEAVTVGLVDQIWVAHTESQASLRATYPDAPSIAVVPNVVDVESYLASTREHPRDVIYPGRFDYWPNEDAVDTLIHEVLPRVEGSTLSVVGRSPTRWMRELDDPRVTVTGLVDDVRPYLAEAGVMAVPLRTGSGTRLKILEAFAASVPVVSTAKGIEGLQVVDGVHYLSAETPDEFAAAIELLDRDRARAAAITDAATALVGEQYSIPALEAVIRDLLSGSAVDRATR